MILSSHTFTPACCRYSFIDPGRIKGWVDLGGWLTQRRSPIQALTERDRRRVNTLIETNALSLSHGAFALYAYTCSVKIRVIFGIRFERRKVDKKHTYMKIETGKLYSGVFWIFCAKCHQNRSFYWVHFLRHSVRAVTSFVLGLLPLNPWNIRRYINSFLIWFWWFVITYNMHTL